MPYKSKKNKNKIKNKKKTAKGGAKRVEKIYITLGRQYTNPDIRGEIRIENGPTSYKAQSKPEYMFNFVSDVAKRFEEDLAVILRGAPDSKNKQKMYKLVYYDNDAPLEEGSENPIKCKRSDRKKKKDKKEKKEKKEGNDEEANDEDSTEKDTNEEEPNDEGDKKKGGNFDDPLLLAADIGLDIAVANESLSWMQYWMLLEERLAINFNDYEWLKKNRILNINDYNPELFSKDRIIKDFCKKCESDPEYAKKISQKLHDKYPNFCTIENIDTKKNIIKKLSKKKRKKLINLSKTFRSNK